MHAMSFLFCLESFFQFFFNFVTPIHMENSKLDLYVCTDTKDLFDLSMQTYVGVIIFKKKPINTHTSGMSPQ